MELLEGLDVDALVGASGPLPAGRAIHLAQDARDWWAGWSAAPARKQTG